jgi:signal transduction histidine kinase/sensor domain CHASE-containing protein/ActR/RegA family two-component response regulator
MTQQSTLVQIAPNYAPMQYNTAICFVLSGVGLVLLVLGKRRLVTIIGAIVVAFGSLTLLQYLADVNLGIDELFWQHPITVKTSHQGRMAPNSALAFALIGNALILVARAIHAKIALLLTEMGTLSVFTLGLIALIGYMTGLSSAYGWGTFTEMALHTAVGHLVLSLGLIAAAWYMGETHWARARRWMPMLAGFGVATVSLLLWQALLAREQEQFRRRIDQQAALLHHEIKSQMAIRTFPLERMAKLWALRGQPDQSIWRDEALYDMQQISGYDAMAWIDPSMQVRWVAPEKVEMGLHRSDFSQSEPQREGLEFARGYREIAFTPPYRLYQGELGFQAVIPIFRGDTFEGWIGGWFNLKNLLDVMLQDKFPNFSMAIMIAGDEVYGRHDESRKHEANWAQESSLSLHGVVWDLRLWPAAQPLGDTFSPLPDLVLASGMVTALLLMSLVHFGQSARLRTRETELANQGLQTEFAGRKQTEQALHISQRFLQAILDALPSHFVILNDSGTVVAANLAWRRFAAARDLTRDDDVLGVNYLSSCHHVVGHDSVVTQLVAAGIQDVIRHQRETFHCEYALQEADETHWFLMRATRFDMDDGLRLVIMHENITDVKLAESELQQQEEKLLQSEKLTMMGSLLAGVAHELNNPLAAIMVQSDLLIEETAQSPLSEQAQMIQQGIERCIHVVQTFLAFARQQPSQRSSVALNQIVEDALSLLSYSFRLDHIEVERQLDAHLPVIWADPHQLNQVVMNLATNAHQAMREHAPPRRLTVMTQASQTQVTLVVEDTGPGIPTPLRDRVFEPFFTTKPVGVGTGLGLSFCKGIIESHGGRILVESEPEQGAIFRIELPIGSAPSAAGEQLPPQIQAGSQGKSILVIDDENSIRRALSRLLSRDGYAVETAANGRLALRQIEGAAYDLILCDWRMPELDGPGFYQSLQDANPDYCRRVIFLTGDVLSPEIEAFLDRHQTPRLHKPFNAADCRQIVRRTLQRLEASDESP